MFCVTGPVLVLLVGGIGYYANASAPFSALDCSSSFVDMTIAAVHRGDISEKVPAYKMQFPANDMISGGDMSHKRSAHELQFPANDMMSGGDGR